MSKGFEQGFGWGCGIITAIAVALVVIPIGCFVVFGGLVAIGVAHNDARRENREQAEPGKPKPVIEKPAVPPPPPEPMEQPEEKPPIFITPSLPPPRETPLPWQDTGEPEKPEAKPPTYEVLSDSTVDDVRVIKVRIPAQASAPELEALGRKAPKGSTVHVYLPGMAQAAPAWAVITTEGGVVKARLWKERAP